MWRALSDIWPVTGLVPVTLTPPRPTRRLRERGLTGEDFGFWSPADISLVDQKPVQALLSSGWELDDGDDDRDFLAWYLARFRAPFGLEFPGLAPAGASRLPVAVLRDAVAAESPAHLGLVAAARPADVPPVVGWSVFGHDEIGPGARSLEIAAVLRSWEARFGARLLRIGADSRLRVLVERPPVTVEAAQRVAAEHIAFADEPRDSGSVADLGEALIGAPIWSFWWD
jgi:hypothetical protein